MPIIHHRVLAAFCLAIALALAPRAATPPASAPPSSALSPVVFPKAGGLETAVDRHIAKLDPARDGWETESFYEAMKDPLHRIEDVWIEPSESNLARLSESLADPFACQALRPAGLESVLEDDLFTVRRPARLTPIPGASDRQGLAGLQAALREISAGFGEQGAWRLHFKPFQLEFEKTRVVTRLYFEAERLQDGSSSQIFATWICHWARPQAGSIPKLAWIGVERYEETTLHHARTSLFADATGTLLSDSPAVAEEVQRGINYWVTRITRMEGMSRYGYHGLAVGDVNNDGREDLYYCNAGGLPNRLFIHQANGSIRDQAEAWGVDFLENTPSALLVDLDNDGWKDLVMAGAPRLLVFRNDGQGHFHQRWTGTPVADPLSMGAADYDNDGDLDLYICGYMAQPGSLRVYSPVPYYDANNGGRNALLRNDGDFRFADVTEDAGLDRNNRRFSFAAAWEDYDNDGDQDLYVANDFGRNNLYQNHRGHFEDVAARAGVEDVGAGMSACWGDFNGDGWMDLYVGNMFSSAGQRVAYQRQFALGHDPDAVEHFQRMARGNTLFQNAGTNGFMDVSDTFGVTLGRWAWASKFADINNDARPDLLIANGYISGEDPKDL